MPSGGYRPGAGRPRGSKDTRPRKPRSAPDVARNRPISSDTGETVSPSRAPPESPAEAFSTNPETFDVWAVLRAIAVDRQVNGIARVKACQLLAEREQPAEGEREPADRIAAKTASILASLGRG